MRKCFVSLTEDLNSSSCKKDVAVRIFHLVRDIPFGFASNFYSQTPEEVLTQQRGFCVTKSKLFVSLLRMADIEAEMHFAILDKNILRGLVQGPSGLDHAFTKVKLNGQWLKVDAYTVDPQLFWSAKHLLEQENSSMGYGIHRDGTIEWNGESDALVQMIGDAVIHPDIGAFSSSEELYQSGKFQK